MADKASGNLSAAVFMDDIRASLGGILQYEPSDENDKWVFAEVSVDATASTDVLDANDSYLGVSTAVATGDIIRWIAIKNTSTTSTEGMAIDLITGTAAYNLKGINVIGPGEMIILKPQVTTVADLHLRSCTVDSYGKVTAQGTATVTVQIAAILDDVA